MNSNPIISRSDRHSRRGQALAEFAVITVVLYLLVGGILTFGYALYVAQGLQQAADVAAREISRTPLPPSMTLDEADGVLYGNANADPDLVQVRRRVFDQHYLVLTVDKPSQQNDEQTFNNGVTIGDLPIVNQQLFPLMISDFVDDGGTAILVVRYPGRVFRDMDTSDDPDLSAPNFSGFLVDIPLDRDPPVTVPVIEEIQSATDITLQNPFQLGSPHRGIVALRLNYPLHSPFLVGFRQSVGGNNETVPAEPNPGLSAGPLGTSYGPYAGEQGFGRQNAMGGNVRPYRQLISGQAIYRREVFSSP